MKDALKKCKDGRRGKYENEKSVTGTSIIAKIAFVEFFFSRVQNLCFPKHCMPGKFLFFSLMFVGRTYNKAK